MYYRMYCRGAIPFMQGYIREYSGQLYYIPRESEDDFRHIINSPDTSWFAQQPTPENVVFLLLTQDGHLVISSIAWRFPLQSMQRGARRFLARRRESRRLALAMALHPRLGGGCPMRAWLNEDILGKICMAI